MGSERDFEQQPYSPDERRVAAWLVEQMHGMVGAGDDPIGFLLASHAQIQMDRDRMRAALHVAEKVCGKNNCNCPGAKSVRHAVADALGE